MQNGISRFILREAMSDILPTSIYQRMDKSILSPHIMIIHLIVILKNEKRGVIKR